MRAILMLPVFVCLLASGCTTGPSRPEVLASLVGRPEADAIRTLGAPNRQIDANGHRFLAWSDQYVGYAPVAPMAPFGWGYYYPASVPVVRGCETTLEVADGRVVSWNLRGSC